MNLSQLHFVLNQKAYLAESIADSNNKWSHLRQLFKEYSRGTQSANREVLSDVLLPDGFVEKVLEESNIIFYKKADSSIWQFEPRIDIAEEITALEVYQLYGSEILERVVERSVAGDEGDDLRIRNILSTQSY